MQGVGSRHPLQAWHFLRELGRAPGNDVEKQVLGTIVEVGMDEGLDLLAAYADRTARYYNHSGAGEVWEGPNTSLDDLVDAMLDGARAIVPEISPSEGPRVPPPGPGRVRLNILTPGSLCFGEGPFGLLEADPHARPLFQAATSLHRKLTEATRGSSRDPGRHGRPS